MGMNFHSYTLNDLLKFKIAFDTNKLIGVENKKLFETSSINQSSESTTVPESNASDVTLQDLLSLRSDKETVDENEQWSLSGDD